MERSNGQFSQDFRPMLRAKNEIRRLYESCLTAPYGMLDLTDFVTCRATVGNAAGAVSNLASFPEALTQMRMAAIAREGLE